MKNAYVNYCIAYLNKPENKKKFTRYGFEQFDDLKDNNKWYRYIDNPLNRIIGENSGLSEIENLYFEKKKKIENIKIRLKYRYDRTMPHIFKKDNKNRQVDTLDILKILFDIDISFTTFNKNPEKYLNKCLPEANKFTLVLITMKDAVDSGYPVESFMEEVAQIDKRNFDSDWSDSDIYFTQKWTTIFKDHNPEFIIFALCNGELVGYFDFFMVSDIFYNEWTKEEKTTIELLEQYPIINYTEENFVNTYLYLDIFVIDKTKLRFTPEIEILITRKFIDRVNIGLVDIVHNKHNINILGIIADGVSDRGARLLKAKGFSKINPTENEDEDNLTGIYKLDDKIFQKIKSTNS